MKRIAEIKKKREHAFWKNRYTFLLLNMILCRLTDDRMIASKDKLRTHRKKAAEKSAIKLLEPLSLNSPTTKVKEKIKIPVRTKSALIAGEGRSMDMDMDVD
jgi:large subunit ribosomal protein L24e